MNAFERDPAAMKFGHEWEQRTRSEEGQPATALDFATTWCPRHLSPFRAEWPDGAGVAMVKLFQAFAADERAQAMAGCDAMRLAAVVHECEPLCCFVGDEVLEPIYRELGKEPPL